MIYLEQHFSFKCTYSEALNELSKS
jgi:hypothetical protein